MDRSHVVRIAIGLFLLPLVAVQLSAQEPFVCGHARAREQAISQDPSILEREAEMEERTRAFIDAHGFARDGEGQVYIIPVVFHILHQNGPENISNEQIFDQVRILNEDFRKLNADTASIVFGFDTIAADCRIEFRLATRDPQGNCTNGIHRVHTIETYQGNDGSKVYPWFRNRYLNVWVARDMADGVAGYAYYPSAAEGFFALADGIMIRHNYVGSIGTSNPGSSRALTHEIGHYLNLPHTWGSTNDPEVACGDDGVADTPETKGWSSCNLSGSVCNPPVIENVQNFMEYAYCSRMYTRGQRDRMHAALNDGLGQRDHLWQEANLGFTGTDGISDLVCAPQADFYATQRFVCTGDGVTFRDNSANATVTSRLWSFTDGSPATSTAEQPVVTFDSPGWKTVTLTVGNDQGTSTYTDQYAVLVASPWGEVSGLLSEGFEDPGSAWNWVPQNLDGNLSYWERVTGVGRSGNACFRMNGYNTSGPDDLFIDDGGNDIDEIISPKLDLGGMSGISVSFWYAYATQTTNLADVTEKLEMYVSSNCGKTWSLRKTITTQELISSGATSAFFVPSTGSAWKQSTVTIPSGLAGPNVRIKFTYVSSGFSNNLYLDDIQMNATVGLSELTMVNELELFPNPSTGLITVTYELPQAQRSTLDVTDLQGRLLHSVDGGVVAIGRITFDARALGLTAGTYLVTLRTAEGQAVRRLVMQ